MSYGTIYVAGGLTSQGGVDDIHWEKLTGFTDVNPGDNVNAQPGVDEIEVIDDGQHQLNSNSLCFVMRKTQG